MPLYTYACDCGTFQTWQPITAAPLSLHDVCGGRPTRVLGPVRTHGLGSSGAKTRAVDKTEKQWDKDRPAYKRLRHHGLQPPHVDGAHELETRASNDLEVNTGYAYGAIPERQVKEAMQEAKESGWAPTRQGVV